MKPLIVLAVAIITVFDESSASFFNFSWQGRNNGQSVQDTLNVCQKPVRKEVREDVQETLDMVIEGLNKLSEAIEGDDVEQIRDSVQDCKESLNQRVTAFQAMVYGVLEGQKENAPDDSRMCSKRMQQKFEMLLSALKEVQSVTGDATERLKELLQDNQFKTIQHQLRPLMQMMQRFVQSPKRIHELNESCEKTLLPGLISAVVKHSGVLRKTLQYTDDVKSKNAAVESVTGILAQTMTYQAICRAAGNLNQPDDVQVDVVNEDIAFSRDIADVLETLIASLLSTKSFIRILFGY